jgi:uncharacterized protein YicC (UPF0701 family)
MVSNASLAKALKRIERLRTVEAEASATALEERLSAIEAKVVASDAKLADAMKLLERTEPAKVRINGSLGDQ